MVKQSAGGVKVKYMRLVHFIEQIQSAVNTYNFVGIVTTHTTAKLWLKILLVRKRHAIIGNLLTSNITCKISICYSNKISAEENSTAAYWPPAAT